MRTMIISALTAAAAAALMGGAGLAAASTHTAVSGTEHFQMMTTSGTGSTASVIASGVFTAPAVDHEHQATNTATFTFSNGNSATFSYTVNGISQVKPITRQIFGSVGTVCH